MTNMNLAVEIPTTLTEQQNNLTTAIQQIDAQIAGLNQQKSEAQQSLERVTNAIRFLRGEVVIPQKPVGSSGTGRTWSPEAKAKLSAALKAAAARKKAAAEGTKQPETAPVAPAPAASQPEAEKAPEKSAKAAKGARK